MKFLCRNCKAKYQIADEKVAGRTLRMTCQQCGEPIVVRGPARQTTGQARVAAAAAPATASPATASPAAAAPMKAPAPAFASQHSAAAKATGAAGLAADIARHAAPPPEPPPPQEEWHVAINDSPVGPLRRDEVARRIAQGILNAESLAWREGMDDWMQIKHIGELASLCASAAPPAPAPHPVPNPASAPTPQPQPRAVAAPAARADMAPIGGRKVVPVDEPPYEPPYEPRESSEPPAEVAVATVGPVVSRESQSSSRQPGWAQMFALVSGGAFILAAGALLGVRVLAPSNNTVQPQPTSAAPAPQVQQPSAPAPSEESDLGEEDDGSGSVIELDMQEIDGRSGTARRSSGSSSSSSSSNDKKKSGQLTAEQKAMLERMGGGLDQGPSNLRAPSETSSSRSQAGQLTAEQLSAVVLNGKKNLQRCYETALRGSSSAETVRLDVDIQVSPHGNVTSVKTSGKGLPGMQECITRTVKMWRFPKSGETTQTRFPVVFQPGA